MCRRGKIRQIAKPEKEIKIHTEWAMKRNVFFPSFFDFEWQFNVCKCTRLHIKLQNKPLKMYICFSFWILVFDFGDLLFFSLLSLLAIVILSFFGCWNLWLFGFGFCLGEIFCCCFYCNLSERCITVTIISTIIIYSIACVCVCVLFLQICIEFILNSVSCSLTL